MYGLVNKAIQDLVVSSAGENAWNRIKTQGKVNGAEFLDSTNYDDEVTHSLVAATSVELGQSAESVLYDFGRHWVLYNGREGWESLFSLGGDNMKTFLMGLDVMYARVQVAMPESRMPQFNVSVQKDHLQVEHYSDREDLEPMVRGIFAGLAERFDEKWDVNLAVSREQQGFDTFELKKILSSSSEGLAQNDA